MPGKYLPANCKGTFTAPADSAGSYNLDDLSGYTAVAAGQSASVGPFDSAKYYLVSNLSFSYVTYISQNVVDNSESSKQDALSGAALTGVTVAVDDYVLIQDKSDSKNLKTVSTQSVANLADLSSKADASALTSETSTRASADTTLQSNINTKQAVL